MAGHFQVNWKHEKVKGKLRNSEHSINNFLNLETQIGYYIFLIITFIDYKSY